MMGDSWEGESYPANIKRQRPQYEGVPAGSDEGLALRYATENAEVRRHVAAWGRWMEWTDDHWAEDRTLSAFDSVRAFCRTIAVENRESAKALASAKTVAAVHTLIRSDRRLAATTDQWDADALLLNTPAGGVDLRTGRMSKHRREDYCSKVTAVAPSGECPLWDRFLDKVTGRDNNLKLFLQRVAGYALTGLTREHAFFSCTAPVPTAKACSSAPYPALWAATPQPRRSRPSSPAIMTATPPTWPGCGARAW